MASTAAVIVELVQRFRAKTSRVKSRAVCLVYGCCSVACYAMLCCAWRREILRLVAVECMTLGCPDLLWAVLYHAASCCAELES